MASEHHAPTSPGDHRNKQVMRSYAEDGVGYNGEEQRGALRYGIGVGARREDETMSIKSNMEENG